MREQIKTEGREKRMKISNRAGNKPLEKLILKVMDYFNVNNVSKILISNAEKPSSVRRVIDRREPAKVYLTGLELTIRINPFYLIYYKDALEYAEKLFYTIVHECKHCIDLADYELINKWSVVEKLKYTYSRREKWEKRPEEIRAIAFTEFHKDLDLIENFADDVLDVAIKIREKRRSLIK